LPGADASDQRGLALRAPGMTISRYRALLPAPDQPLIVKLPGEGASDDPAKTAFRSISSPTWYAVVLHRQAPYRERAGAGAGGAVEIHWRPFFLNPWVPREGISRDEYLTAKFGSVEAYKGIAGRVVAAAGEEGLTYRPDLVKRQPTPPIAIG